MVNKVNVQKWVDALRSDEYDQCTGQLRNDSGFCCLGVATDVAMKEGVVITSDVYDGVVFEGWTPRLSEYGLMPRSVRDWLGMDDSNPILFEYDDIEEGELYQSTAAAEANDDLGYSFDKIAALIEERYLNG